MRLPCWCFCIKELVKLQLVVAHQVLLQFVNTVRVLCLENNPPHELLCDTSIFSLYLKQGILAKNCHSSPCRHVVHPENTSAIAGHIAEDRCVHHNNSRLSENKIIENYANWSEDETSTTVTQRLTQCHIECNR